MLDLTEEEKARIKAEEIYRAEVKDELEKAHSRKTDLWSILNSGFVLFLLSSVVVTLLSSLGTQTYNDYVQRKEKTELITKLNSEIAYRIAISLNVLSNIKNNISGGENYSASDIYSNSCYYLDNKVVTGMAGEPDPDFSLFPEFQHRTFCSLVEQLPLSEAKSNVVLGSYQTLLNKGSAYLPAAQRQIKSPTPDSQQKQQGSVDDAIGIISNAPAYKGWGIMLPEWKIVTSVNWQENP